MRARMDGTSCVFGARTDIGGGRGPESGNKGVSGEDGTKVTLLSGWERRGLRALRVAWVNLAWDVHWS